MQNKIFVTAKKLILGKVWNFFLIHFTESAKSVSFRKEK